MKPLDLTHPKCVAMRKGDGPHWVCYRCDVMVDVDAACPQCETWAYVARCNRRVCGRCADEQRRAIH